MTIQDGKWQQKLLRFVNFTPGEDAKILGWIKAERPTFYMAKMLHRSVTEVKCHIFAKTSLRIAARSERAYQEMRERYEYALSRYPGGWEELSAIRKKICSKKGFWHD